MPTEMANLAGKVYDSNMKWKSVINSRNVENSFAGQHNNLIFLSHSYTEIGRAESRAYVYVCATFFMDAQSKHYGNQLSNDTGCPTMSIDEFLEL